jgi:hypothetical protein
MPPRGATKPTTDFHKDRSRRDGLRDICKTCAGHNTRRAKEARDPGYAARSAEFQAAKNERAQLRALGQKRCLAPPVGCGEVKAITEFLNKTDSTDGHDNICKACHSTRSATYYSRNSERIKQNVRTYQSENKDKITKRRAAHYQANREDILARQAAAYAADPKLRKGKQDRARKWAQDNPEQARTNVTKGGATRRARIKGLPAEAIEAIDRLEIFERDGWQCQAVNCKASTRDIDKQLKFPHPWSASLDHVVALAAGGAHLKTNVQCAHLRCNQQKQR